ncbi:hypothetical protein F5877DRAFT_4786, partial [Lentinula edodes]
YDAVSRVKSLNEAVSSLILTLQFITDRLKNVTASNEVDGTPPTLMANECLDPIHHSVFIALLLFLLHEHAKNRSFRLGVSPSISRCELSTCGLGIQANTSTQLLRLTTLRERRQHLNENTIGRVAQIARNRRIRTTVHATLGDFPL